MGHNIPKRCNKVTLLVLRFRVIIMRCLKNGSPEFINIQSEILQKRQVQLSDKSGQGDCSASSIIRSKRLDKSGFLHFGPPTFVFKGSYFGGLLWIERYFKRW